MERTLWRTWTGAYAIATACDLKDVPETASVGLKRSRGCVASLQGLPGNASTGSL